MGAQGDQQASPPSWGLLLGSRPRPTDRHALWPPRSNFPLPPQVEQVSQLAVFIEAALDYHRQSTEILQELQNKLHIR